MPFKLPIAAAFASIRVELAFTLAETSAMFAVLPATCLDTLTIAFVLLVTSVRIALISATFTSTLLLILATLF